MVREFYVDNHESKYLAFIILLGLSAYDHHDLLTIHGKPYAPIKALDGIRR